MSALLEVARVGAKSVVVGAKGQTPLALLNPMNHGDASWVYQSSHGGGFVTDDAVGLEVRVEPHATLFLSSQSSSKVYRGTHATFSLHAHLAPHATLVNWPDPTSCFAGSSFAQRLRFDCAETSSLLCVDAYTAGRVAHCERWQLERYESRVFVDVAGHSVFREALVLSGHHGPLAMRMGDADAFATVLVRGPRFATLIEALQTEPTAARTSKGLVLRLASPTVESLTSTLKRCLRAQVAALLGDDPCARKW